MPFLVHCARFNFGQLLYIGIILPFVIRDHSTLFIRPGIINADLEKNLKKGFQVMHEGSLFAVQRFNCYKSFRTRLIRGFGWLLAILFNYKVKID
jgi:hypothetical protein